MAGDGTRMELKAAEFNARLTEIQQQLGREGGAFVQTQARRLVLKFAYLAPIKTGRLRAGFWPAASALAMTNIYTPHPNIGEGAGVNNSTAKNPSVTIINSVPYVANAGGRGTGWWFAAMSGIEQRMEKDLVNALRNSWGAGR